VKTIDWVRWIPILANHAERHQMHHVLLSNVFDRWLLAYKQSRESAPDADTPAVDRYRTIWRSTPQIANSWQLFKRRYPVDFVEFIDEHVAI
jgi:hypothetical protein